jgi:hypothetical protein
VPPAPRESCPPPPRPCAPPPPTIPDVENPSASSSSRPHRPQVPLGVVIRGGPVREIGGGDCFHLFRWWKGLLLLVHRSCRLNLAALWRRALPNAREANCLLGASHLDADAVVQRGVLALAALGYKCSGRQATRRWHTKRRRLAHAELFFMHRRWLTKRSKKTEASRLHTITKK